MNFVELAAFMVNRVTWNTTDSEPFLEADMKLNVILEVASIPPLDHW